VAPLVRTGGSRHTGLAALPHRNIHFYNYDQQKPVDKSNQYFYKGYRNISPSCPVTMKYFPHTIHLLYKIDKGISFDSKCTFF
ncbi:MAG: hypothetical protein SOR50_11070, partial [Blautia sp.]|nr:hypothetical protein [Blautia sp.]